MYPTKHIWKGIRHDESNVMCPYRGALFAGIPNIIENSICACDLYQTFPFTRIVWYISPNQLRTKPEIVNWRDPDHGLSPALPLVSLCWRTEELGGSRMNTVSSSAISRLARNRPSVLWQSWPGGGRVGVIRRLTCAPSPTPGATYIPPFLAQTLMGQRKLLI